LFALDVGGLSFVQNEQEPYRIDIDTFALVSYDSYYKNFITHMSNEHRLQIRIEEYNHSPVVKIKNGKIIYISRLITEIKEFQKAVEKEIMVNAQKLADTESLKLAPKNPETPKAALDTGKKSLFKLEIENSCLVMPRNSHSKDIFVAMFDKMEAYIGKYFEGDECFNLFFF